MVTCLCTLNLHIACQPIAADRKCLPIIKVGIINDTAISELGCGKWPPAALYSVNHP